MFNKLLLAVTLSLLALTLLFTNSFAADELSQYGEVYSIFNKEVKIRAKNPMTQEIYYFKFGVGWDTTFEGINGLDDIKVGDYISVNYVLDLSNNATAVKISLPKELSTKSVSPSGAQTYDANEPLVKILQEEIKGLKAEVSSLKEELKKQQAKE